MKYLIILSLFLVSCDNTPTKVENTNKETTIEIQQLAEKDTILYKVVELKDQVYCINTKTNLVERKISNDSGYMKTFGLFLFIIIIVCIIGFFILLD